MLEQKELMNYLADYMQNNHADGVDANTVAEFFGVWRNEAVAGLSALVHSGQAVKSGSKPILYRPCSSEKKEGSLCEKADPPPFSRVVGYNGSLKFQIQLASAAVSYPPHGVHTLIVGETGVGKSLMASEMARYLCQTKGKAEGEIPFVTFNCAEYADNPQLLLSQLFGYVKGSFTGADHDKAGLIEKADGGILFLDEIHRLPATGQEMLFTVVDKGLYRRLGDTVERTARFMIVGATTENPSNFLLNTFKRRMPLIIQIPLLSDRPINERLDIICLFLRKESCQLNLPIRISFLALKILSSFRGENNIGDLKNEVQIACARGFLEHERLRKAQTPRSCLNIDIYNLSRKLSVNYIADDRVDRFFSSAGLENGLEISPDQEIIFSPCASSDAAPDSMSFPDGQIWALQETDQDPVETGRRLVSDFEHQYRMHPAGFLYGSITPTVWSTTSELIHFAAEEFGRSYEQSKINSIAYYLQQLKAYADAGRIIFSPTNFDSAKFYSKEYTFVKKMVHFLRKRLSIDMMDGELVLLAMLLAHGDTVYAKPNRNLLLVGYGNIASQTAALSNELLNTNFIKAFNITNDTDLETVSLRLSRIFENDQHDTLVLSGLGISPLMERAFGQIALFHYQIISALDPAIAMECGRMILTTDNGIDEIAESILADYKDYFSGMPAAAPNAASAAAAAAERESTAAPADMRDVIITYCITGTGSARSAREILLHNLSISSTTDVLPLGIMDDIFSIASRLGKRLKLIIGILNPNIPGIPFVSIEQILYSDNCNELLRCKGINIPTDMDLEAQEISQMPLEARLNHCREHLDYFAPSLDANTVDQAAQQIIQKISAMYRSPLQPDFVVRIYIHCATMFERVNTTEPVPMPLDGYAAVEHNIEMFTLLRESLSACGKNMRLSISDAEVYYLMMTLPPTFC